MENEAARQEAVVATLERNPFAFRPKIACSPRRSRGSMVHILTPTCAIDCLTSALPLTLTELNVDRSNFLK